MQSSRLFLVTLGAMGLGPGSRPTDTPQPTPSASAQAGVIES
jgi:hypothetical protein